MQCRRRAVRLFDTPDVDLEGITLQIFSRKWSRKLLLSLLEHFFELFGWLVVLVLGMWTVISGSANVYRDATGWHTSVAALLTFLAVAILLVYNRTQQAPDDEPKLASFGRGLLLWGWTILAVLIWMQECTSYAFRFLSQEDSPFVVTILGVESAMCPANSTTPTSVLNTPDPETVKKTNFVRWLLGDICLEQADIIKYMMVQLMVLSVRALSEENARPKALKEEKFELLASDGTEKMLASDNNVSNHTSTPVLSTPVSPANLVRINTMGLVRESTTVAPVMAASSMLLLDYSVLRGLTPLLLLGVVSFSSFHFEENPQTNLLDFFNLCFAITLLTLYTTRRDYYKTVERYARHC